MYIKEEEEEEERADACVVESALQLFNSPGLGDGKARQGRTVGVGELGKPPVSRRGWRLKTGAIPDRD